MFCVEYHEALAEVSVQCGGRVFTEFYHFSEGRTLPVTVFSEM